ncbi:hypothetical protein [Methylocapsa palsarum]|nr:hypothetical protein [Methylocapsa palsarum]
MTEPKQPTRPPVKPAGLRIEPAKNTAAEIARALVDEIKEPDKLHLIASLLIDGAKAKEAAVKGGGPKPPIAPAEHGPKELAQAMSPNMFATPIVPVKPAQEDYARIDREIGPLPPNPTDAERAHQDRLTQAAALIRIGGLATPETDK